mmetsp:Transcript_12641/g.18988  ORF Transcript_12641/g.18988 Transcript_12641/m.18988 type:complete len:350 (+) Transcript_12641:141-1190(+)
MIRRTVSLARGRFSSMLDMGGVAPIKADTNSRMDMGKNNKVRSIALDFDLIARNIAHDKEEDATAPPTSSNAGRTMTVRLSQEASTVTRKITPDVGMVQSIAKLLNVKLGSDGKKKDDFAKDDLSALESPSVSGTLHDARTSSRAAKPVKFPPMSDVRDKYAEKINRKLDGGSLAGVDRAKLEKSQKKGDAFHIQARTIAAAEPVMKSGSKWLANTGTGNLLAYLTNRSMRIALVPKPNTKDDDVGDDMDSLSRQLPNVRINSMIKDGERQPNEILNEVLSKADGIPEIATLVVSDRDDYLKVARDMGMYTCRVQLKNVRRGSCTTDYTVSSIAEVQDIVNDINGISFR